MRRKKNDKTVTNVIEEVCCAFCDKYCKYNDRYEKEEIDEDNLFRECNKCIMKILY